MGNKPKQLLPVEELRALYHYDPDTGVLWSKRRGKPITKVTSYGYLTVGSGVKGSVPTMVGHRICWALHYGEDPYPDELDHINRDKVDNRIANLRKVTSGENNANKDKYRNNTSGHTGVRREPYGNWTAHIGRKYLGYYATKDEAIAARREAEEQHGYQGASDKGSGG